MGCIGMRLRPYCFAMGFWFYFKTAVKRCYCKEIILQSGNFRYFTQAWRHCAPSTGALRVAGIGFCRLHVLPPVMALAAGSARPMACVKL